VFFGSTNPLGGKVHLLAIAATARPSHNNEPIPREAMEAEAKLAAEASPEEVN
jgi:hypothetical protein